jgi:hypothetical protein
MILLLDQIFWWCSAFDAELLVASLENEKNENYEMVTKCCVREGMTAKKMRCSVCVCV